jgi:hypothetical protein
MIRRSLPAAVLLALLAVPWGARCQPAPAPPASPGAEEAPQAEIPRRGDDDEPDLPALALGRWFTLGGSAQAEWNTVRRPAGLAEDALEPEMGSALQLRTTLSPARGVVLFARTEWRRAAPTESPGWWRTGETTGRLVEAYADLDRPLGLPLGVRVGRQRFRDAQEWFFDDYLDAVRLRAQAGRWRFDAALTGTVADAPLLERDTAQRQHVIATVSRRVTRQMRATGFYIRRGDTAARRDTPWWVGGSLASRGEHAVMFHAIAAMRRGRLGDTRLGGWATDTMVRWHIDAAGKPAVSLGYARASGDASTADGLDGGFRQTDLQDNSTRVGGIRRVRMYGEAFDPELANLQVLTAALSLRPARLLSLDLIGHHYTQVVARRRLADHAFDARANGEATHLGSELDVQVVARPARRIDLRLIVGVFRPGEAFAAQPGAGVTTIVWRPQVRVYF